MPIMSAYGRNDARNVARLMAQTVTECLVNPAHVPEREVVLNNVYELLEAFRSNPYFGLEPNTRSSVRAATDDLSLLPSGPRHMRAVQTAIKKALAAHFSGQSEEDAVTVLEEVLRSLAYPDESPVDDPKREKAVGFFREMADELRSN